MKRRRPPRLYFSFRSPYSWLTVHRLRRAVPEVFEAFELFPYWDPDPTTCEGLQGLGGEFHYIQMSRAKHLYMLLDTKRLAEQEGMSIAWPIDVDPWWELPHLAWLLARRQGRAVAFYDAVTEARWGRGEDICDPEVVAAAATRAGLDPALAVAAPDDPDLRKEGVECLYQAYLDDVFGIPYLKWGRHRFWGFDRLDAFLGVWRHEGGEGPVPARLPEVSRSYDTDSAGGCG